MDALYNKVCQECSRVTTNSYSTSFSLGIRMFKKEFRQPIYSIYGLVRFADEIVDTFYEIDQSYYLDQFENETFSAIDQKFSLNPILQAFQEVVNTYEIDRNQIRAFFNSMRMDLNKTIYNRPSYNDYIYGSAEVIGLMCLKIFTQHNPEEYYRLEQSARALGSAFQKVNFLRDLKSDYKDRGRVYFPNVDMDKFSDSCKQQIEKEIEKEFEMAKTGILQLPIGVRTGVYTAFIYYLKLFKKIKSSSKERLLTDRIRVSDPIKLFLLSYSTIKIKFFT